MNERLLANRIATDILAAGDEPPDKCHRIAFKGGSYPDGETNLGGFCQSALADCIHQSLIAARDEDLQKRD